MAASYAARLRAGLRPALRRITSASVPGGQRRRGPHQGQVLCGGVGFGVQEVPTMTDHRNPEHLTGRSATTLVGIASLPTTADESRGSSTLATIPRAGNISSDARAGRPG